MNSISTPRIFVIAFLSLLYCSTAFGACSLPTGMNTTLITNTSADIQWTAVAGASSYKYQYRPTGTTSWFTGNTTGTGWVISSLIPSTTYEWQVETVCTSGVSGFTTSTDFTTLAPCGSPPTGFGSFDIEDTYAAIYWNNVTGISGYNYRYRPIGASTWTTGSVNVSAINISGLTGATNYEFQAQAICSGGITSSFSSSFNFTTQPPCIPPTAESTANITGNSANLKWSSPYSNFIYEYKPTGSSIWVTGITNFDSVTISGLDSYSPYEWQVATYCGFSTSTFSQPTTFTTTGCNIPTLISATNVTGNGATLSWNIAPGGTSYNLEYMPVNGSGNWTVQQTSAISYNAQNLMSNTTYEWQVSSNCSQGTSTYSSPLQFTTGSGCNKPTGLYTTTITNNSAALNWNAPYTSKSIYYNYQYRQVGTTNWTSGQYNQYYPYSDTIHVTNIPISGLNASAMYEWQVQTVCSAGPSAFSASDTFTTLAGCNYPVGGTATNIGTTTATLSWLPVPGAKGYIVYVDFIYVQYGWISSPVVIDTVTRTFVNLTGLKPSEYYDWQVLTICSDGTVSPFTGQGDSYNDFPYLFQMLDECDVPTNAAAIGVNNSYATLTWSPVPGATSYSYDYSYLAYCYDSYCQCYDESCNYEDYGPYTTTDTSVRITLPIPYPATGYAQYNWEVQTNCSAGTSSFVGTSIYPNSPCTTPYSEGSTNVTSNSATINWYTGEQSAISYNYQYWPASNPGNITSGVVSANYTALTLVGLQPSTEYEWQVQSNCIGGTSTISGTSEYSSVDYIFTLPASCNSPTGANTTNIGGFSAQLNWSAASGDSSYVVLYMPLGGATWTQVSTNTNSITISGLTSETTYQWEVASACTGGGYSAYTSPVSFTTLGTCPFPTGLSTANIISTGATFKWSPISGVQIYSVRYMLQGGNTWTNSSTNTDSFVVAGLTPSTAYEWEVQTGCSAGSSSFTAATNFTTIGANVCNIPTGLQVVSVTPTTVTLSWSPAVGATGYYIFYEGVSGNPTGSAFSNTDTVFLAGLDNGSYYQWEVSTQCAAGTSTYSNWAEFQPGTCNQPTGMNTTGITSTAATLNWTAALGSSYYYYQYRAIGAANWSGGTTSGTSIGISGLIPLTAYEWQIGVACLNGSAPPYTVSTDFTTLSACGVPTGMSTANIGTNSATFKWANVPGATSYKIQYIVVGGSTWTSVTATVDSINITGLTTGTNYQWVVQTVCPAGVSSFTAATSFSTATPTYCTSKGAYTTFEYINNVTLGSINNTSGNNNGYANYTNLSTNLTAGSTYTISLTPGFNSGAEPEYFTVYIDYNQNGAFTDAGELAFEGNGSSTVTGSITVPATATLGPTRMRVQMQYNFYETNPCASYTFGEVEDYTVNISGAAACNAPTGMATANITTSSATLKWLPVSGATGGYNILYRVIGTTTWTTGRATTDSLVITGLSASTSYEWQVQTACTGSSSAFTASTNFTTSAQCGVPTGMSTTNVTSSAATFNWSTVTGAQHWNIQYRVVGTTTWSTGVSGSSPFWTITGLIPATTYEWQVQTVCTGGNSAFTASTNFTTLAACNTPTGMSTTSITSSSATFNWAAVSGASSYVVQYMVVGGSTWTSATATVDSFKVAGLTASTNYQWEVQTVCSAGSSPFTAATNFTTNATACGIPTGMATTNITSSAATFNWSTVTGAQYWNIQYRVVGTTTWSTGVSGSSPFWTITGLSPATNYEWQVQTVCSGGNSAFTASTDFTTLVACNTPTGMSTANITTSSATFKWANVSGATSYKVQYIVVGGTTWANATAAVDSFNVTGLTTGTSYQWEVQTICSGGSSAFSGATNFTTLTGCGVPTGEANSSITGTSAIFLWNSVQGANSYNVQYRVVGTSPWTTVSTTINSVGFGNLTLNTTYEWQVQSVCSTGNSAFSASTDVTTPACISPTAESVTNVTTTSATFNWSVVSGSSGYVVEYGIVNNTPWTSVTVSTNTYNVSGLTSGSNYEWEVNAICSAGGNSNWTPGPYFNTTSCGVPTDQTTSFNTTSATFGWAVMAGATGYNVQYRVVGTTAWTSGSAVTHVFAANNLESGTLYEWQVQTVCSSGNSAFSASSDFTTTGTACTLPNGMNTTNIAAASAQINWIAVSGATGYNYQYRLVGTTQWTSGNVSSSFTAASITGLIPGSNYEWQVQTNCSTGNSAFTASTNFTTPTACNTPTGLSNANLSVGGGTFKWANVSGATGYNVQYQIIGATSWTTATTTVDSFNVTGLVGGGNYQWEVQTICGTSNTSAFSAPLAFTPLTNCTNAPSNPFTSNISNTSASLNWTPVNGSIVGYDLHIRPITTSTWSNYGGGPGNIPVTNLTPATTYVWQVQTECSPTSVSAYTVLDTFTTTNITCAVPTGTTTNNITASSAKFNWAPVSGANSYLVQYTISGAYLWTSVTATVDSVTITGLASSTNYQWEVATNCTGGISPFTSSTNFMTSGSSCGLPTSPSTVNITSSSATFKWANMPGAVSYNVQYQIVGATLWTSATTSVDSFTVTGLSPSTNYEWQVQTVCSGTSSYIGDLTSFTTTGPCNTPSGTSTANITGTSATFKWATVSGATSYKVQYMIVGGSTWTSATASVDSFNVTGLNASTNYEWEVQTVCSGGSSAFTGATNFTTSGTPCNTPTGMSTTSITSSSATFNWAAVSGAASYTVQYMVVGGSTWTSVTATVDSVNVRGLAASTNYEWEVQTVCSGGSSAFTAAVNFTTSASTVTYCTSTGTNTEFEYINNVTIGTINNTSGNNNGYANFTNLSTNLTSGAGTTISLTPGFSSGSYDEFFTVYIDYNHNGVFTDAGETVAEVNGSSTVTGSFTVPATALTGATRMRVQMQYGAYETSPCATYTFGEVEDYTVNIVSGTACNAPTGMSTANITTNSATFKWANVSGAASYKVQYMVVGGSTWTSATASVDSFNVAGLNASTNYEWEVQTVCSGGSSAFTSATNFTTSSPPCNVPTGMSTANITTSSATFKWANVSGATSYKVQYMVVGGSTWTSATASVDSFNVTGLTASTNYEWEVQTVCSGGSSAFTAATTFTTSAAACNVPTGMSTANITSTSATFKWAVVSGAISYKVQYMVVGGATWTSATATVDSFNVTGLTAGTDYQWEVQTVCSGGSSAFTAATMFTTSAPPCSVPTGMSTANITSSSATFKWANVSGATSYKVQYMIVGGSTWTSATASVDSFNVTGLTASTNYEWEVQTVCSGGNSAFSAVSIFESTCPIPTGLESYNFTPNTASVMWSPVAGAIGYNVRYMRLLIDSTWTTVTTNSDSTILAGLIPGTVNYYWEVSTICSAGTSTFSGYSTFGTPCVPPTGTTTSHISSTSATFNWAPALTSIIQYMVVGGSAWTSATASGDSVNITGLAPATNYEWELSANCGSGVPYFGPPIYFTTLTAPCNAPTSMSTANVTSSSATFKWAAVSGATSFKVQYMVVGGSTWTSATASVDSFNVTGLTASTNYQWEVQTVCSGGSSAFTAATNFTTLTGSACNTPTGMSTAGITASQATFKWLPVNGASTYNVQYRIVGTTTWSTGSASPDSINVNGLTSGSNYEWQVQSVCSGGNSSFTASTNFTTVTVTYCASKGTYTTFEYINNVKLGSINNTSGNNNGYGNYTNLSTNLTGGTAYTISLTPGFPSGSDQEFWTVYIDYNQNGLFTDAGEMVLEVNGSAAVSGSFTVPVAALNGPTRMRIQMQYSYYETNPCATYTFGEVEDYTVNITGNAKELEISNSVIEAPGFDNIKVYPNPTQNNLNVQFNSNTDGKLWLNIYNISGQRVLSQEKGYDSGLNTQSIDVSPLSGGIYILELQTQGIVERLKFVVTK